MQTSFCRCLLYSWYIPGSRFGDYQWFISYCFAPLDVTSPAVAARASRARVVKTGRKSGVVSGACLVTGVRQGLVVARLCSSSWSLGSSLIRKNGYEPKEIKNSQGNTVCRCTLMRVATVFFSLCFRSQNAKTIHVLIFAKIWSHNLYGIMIAFNILIDLREVSSHLPLPSSTKSNSIFPQRIIRSLWLRLAFYIIKISYNSSELNFDATNS